MSAQLSRRGFLRVTATAAGGMLIAVRVPAAEREAALTTDELAPNDFTPNAFVRIAKDGKVTVIVNKSEMGQGISTSLTMVLAEELDADWQTVGFEFAPADAAFVDPNFGIQATGGSTSTMGMTEPMREAGAAARAMLVAAAAQQWNVPASECTTRDSVVAHAGSGRTAGYGELAAAAAKLPVPKDVPRKAPSEWRLVGKPTHRLDSAAKVDGTAVFSLDVNLPGMLTALVAHPPTCPGTANKSDARTARAVPGVVDVVDVGSGVAVIGTGFWPCKQGRDLLAIEWDLGAGAGLSTEALRAQFRELAGKPGLVARSDGDADKVLGESLGGSLVRGTVVRADYELPYVAHAPMEPLNCVVDLKADSMEIWVGTQFQTIDHANACKEAGLPAEKVKLHTTFLGGGFGRRANPASDYVKEAVKIAKACKAPVKMLWTRTDDLRAGYYRPMWHNRLAAAIDGNGEITAWKHTIVGQSISKGTLFEPEIKDGIDGASVEGAMDLPYAIANVRVELHSPEVPVPVQWWRSVGHSHTAFAVESFLDELAAATKQDPLALRQKLLAGKDRKLVVLALAAEKSGWSTPCPAGRARGLAVHESFNSCVATVLEVSLERGWPKVHKATVAVDCGRTINPDTVEAQLQGATGFALTTALYSGITLKDGRIEQSNFHDFRLLRVHEMPEVSVHVVPSDAPPTGIGEPAVPPVAPALCNALFRLTGKRVRRLPIQKEDLV
jgi:isoquinoline 1-oxidoreductase subunit beta